MAERKKQNPLDDIMEKLEQGVKDVFQSDQYKKYLQTMSRFSTYSFQNSVLIHTQKPDASLVAGYKAWQVKFQRHVKAGEKGLKIIAPMPMKTDRFVEKKDPKTGKVLLDGDGKPIMEPLVLPQYRVVTVFDISQTEGKELPTPQVAILKGLVPRFQDFMDAIQKICPVPMSIEPMDMDANGYYHQVEKRIVIKEGMSEAQTLKTAIHETAHAILHDRDRMKEENIQKDTHTREVEAESVAYTVCQHFGLDTSDYSFGYIATWSESQKMNELRSSMDTIRHASSSMITGMEALLMERERERSVTYEVYSLKQSGIATLYEGRSLERLGEDGLSVHPEYYTLRAQGIMPAMESQEAMLQNLQSLQEMQKSDVVVLAGAMTATYYMDTAGLTELPTFDLSGEHGTSMEVSTLAAEMDTLLYQYDHYGYNDSFDTREEGRAVVQDELMAGNVRNIRDGLVPIAGDEDSPQYAQCAQELLEKMEVVEQNLGFDLSEKTESISYYVAESMAFPVLGEYRETATLEDAKACYDQLPDHSLHGGKGIGATLETSDGARRDVPLMIDGKIQREHLENKLFNASPALQKAFSGLEKMMPARTVPTVSHGKGGLEL